jgi:hypothetical protein
MPTSAVSPRSCPLAVVRRRAWWFLVFVAVVLVVFGIVDMVSGPQADPGISLAIAGASPDEVRSVDPLGYRLFDFATRALGLALVILGLQFCVILLGPYRRGRPWAWAAAWLLPAWAIAVPLLYLAFGTTPGQPPAPPMVSGPIIAIVAAAVLLVDRGRFRKAHSDRSVHA